MNRVYDEFLLLPKGLLCMGAIMAIVLNVFISDPLPLSAHVALGFFGITFGVFSFSLYTRLFSYYP